MSGHLDLDATGGPTGYFGARTDQAVRNFQKDAGLTVDGRLNPDGETISELWNIHKFPDPGTPPVKQLLPVTPEDAEKWRGTLPRPAIVKPGYVWDKDHWRVAAPEEERANEPRITLLAADAEPAEGPVQNAESGEIFDTARSGAVGSQGDSLGASESDGSESLRTLPDDPSAPDGDVFADEGDDSDIDFDGGFEADFSLGAEEDGEDRDSYFGRSLIELYEDEWLAAQQGTSPVVQAVDGTYYYERAPAREQGVFAEAGRVTSPDKYVVLRDPETGMLAVWNRNPEMNESGAVRAGRWLGAGLLTDPIRVGPAARAVSRAARGVPRLAEATARANRKFGQWVADIRTAAQARAAGKPPGKAVPRMVRVGVMDGDVQRFVRSRGIVPVTADITATDKGIFHMTRQAKAEAGKALPMEAVERMPEILGNPSAVLWDKNKKNLAYVFDVPGDPKKGKFVVTVNFLSRTRSSVDGKRTTQIINDVTTGGWWIASI